MQSSIAPAPPGAAGPSRATLLRRFLQAYWLRPENALWMTLRSDVLGHAPLGPPVIDVSCGDGVFMFLHCGGEFDPSFDVFQAVIGLDRVRDEHVDMFECLDDAYRPRMEAPPSSTIAVGCDLKPALLAKAERLGIYGRLVRADNNQPLPFDDEAFETVYCNAAYWVRNIGSFLDELRRITRCGGRIILQVKLDSIRRYTLASHRAVLGDRFLAIIGRGRAECWPTLADRRTWEARFSTAGLIIDQAVPFVTRTHAHLWDIGLRPIAPLLARMANALSPDTRIAIKADWVDLFCDLAGPFCDPNLDIGLGTDEPAEIQYVLLPRDMTARSGRPGKAAALD